MRSEVSFFLQVKVDARPHKDALLDVGAWQRDKTKEKEKAGTASKPKVEGKETEKHDITVKFEGCFSKPNCGKWGRRWTDTLLERRRFSRQGQRQR